VEMATQAGATVVYHSRRSLVIAAKDSFNTEYPAACLSDYQGSALNVLYVPSTPVRPVVHHPFPTSDAPNPKITALLGLVTSTALRGFVTTLSTNLTRLSTSDPAKLAVTWARQNFSANGWNAVEQSINRSGYCNNVVATKVGTVNPNDIVVFGAHVDCRASNINNATQRAPGADDNGTGSAAVLNLAQLINLQKLTFQNTLVLTLFCGEEQGLYGSNFQAKNYKSQNAKILAMYNADMLGYNYQNANTLGLVSRSSDSVETSSCRTVINDYFPSLRTGSTTACCSDQQSYYNEGYAAVGVFEGATSSVTYPEYHTSNDAVTNTNINWDQVAAFSKAVYSCVLTRAIPN